MMWSDVGVVASAVIAVAGVLGLLVRYVLMPYLLDQVVRPVRETHRQVTTHDHDRKPADDPTVVDRLDDMLDAVEEVKSSLDDLGKKARENRRLAIAAGGRADAVAKRLSDHVAWSGEEDSRLWSVIRKIERKVDVKERGNTGGA